MQCEQNLYLFLMPTIGASTHVIQKFLFECEALVNYENKKFQKPFFYTWLGSVGLFLSFIIQFSCNFSQFVNKFLKSRKYLSSFFLLAVSTFFNLAAGALANVSNLYLNYSVSLMLRSSTLIFGALISEFYLKKKLHGYQKQGVYCTIISIFFIGFTALLSGSKTTHRQATPYIIGFHVFIRILSKSLQAVSMLIEEKVMQSGITPIELSGLSGIWSFLLSTFLLLPFENMKETFIMIQNNKIILSLSILSVIVFGVWTILALFVTNKVSAVARMVFDQLTIVVVWICQLLIYYIVRNTKYEDKYIKAGEEWNKWSFLQLIGFIIMIYGAMIYQKIIKPFWKKEFDEIPLLVSNFHDSESISI